MHYITGMTKRQKTLVTITGVVTALLAFYLGIYLVSKNTPGDAVSYTRSVLVMLSAIIAGLVLPYIGLKLMFFFTNLFMKRPGGHFTLRDLPKPQRSVRIKGFRPQPKRRA